HLLPEGELLTAGEVAYQAQERHRRRLDRPAGHLLGVQTFTLDLEREPLVPQRRRQGRLLVPQPGQVLTRILVEIQEHVGPPARAPHASSITEVRRMQPILSGPANRLDTVASCGQQRTTCATSPRRFVPCSRRSSS